jgi:uncharacterized protein
MPLSGAATAVLILASVLGGTLNSVVGGGSFICFPALLLAGIPPVSANATTTFVLWPAAVASGVAYRRELKQPRSILIAYSGASLVGGALGGLFLVRTSNATFAHLVPWLMLFASLLFSFGGALARHLGSRATAERRALFVGTLVQLVISIYGGYFGGGMGIMMLAVWTALGMTDVHGMNALRTLCGALLNGVALAVFVTRGLVAWQPALAMMVGATSAGYLGAAMAQRIEPRWVRRFILSVAWAMTGYFIIRELA